MQSFFMRTAKTLIRLRGFAGWSESLFGGHVRRYVLKTEWTPPHYILEDSNFDLRYVRLCDLDILREKWLNYLQTVETLIRRRVLQCLPDTFLRVSRLQWVKWALVDNAVPRLKCLFKEALWWWTIFPICEQQRQMQVLDNLGYLTRVSVFKNTVEPRYLELAYFELPLISKWKSGPCFNMKLWQLVTK